MRRRRKQQFFEKGRQNSSEKRVELLTFSHFSKMDNFYQRTLRAEVQRRVRRPSGEGIDREEDNEEEWDEDLGEEEEVEEEDEEEEDEEIEHSENYQSEEVSQY